MIIVVKVTQVFMRVHLFLSLVYSFVGTIYFLPVSFQRSKVMIYVLVCSTPWKQFPKKLLRRSCFNDAKQSVLFTYLYMTLHLLVAFHYHSLFGLKARLCPIACTGKTVSDDYNLGYNCDQMCTYIEQVYSLCDWLVISF